MMYIVVLDCICNNLDERKRQAFSIEDQVALQLCFSPGHPGHLPVSLLCRRHRVPHHRRRRHRLRRRHHHPLGHLVPQEREPQGDRGHQPRWAM